MGTLIGILICYGVIKPPIFYNCKELIDLEPSSSFDALSLASISMVVASLSEREIYCIFLT